MPSRTQTDYLQERKINKEVRFAALLSKSRRIKHAKDVKKCIKVTISGATKKKQVKPKVFSTLKNSSKELLTSFFNFKSKHSQSSSYGGTCSIGASTAVSENNSVVSKAS